MLPYKYILLLLSVTIISIQQATAKKDEESKQVDRQFMTWSPTIAPPPNTPFPTYNSNNGDGLIPINSLSLPPIIPILPPEQCSPNLLCTQELQQCTDGTTESCCGNTYESFICNCEISLESGELQWMCYYTDYCFLPSCDDGDDGGVGVAIDDGEVSDALQSTLPVETDAPVSSPVTAEPTTANLTTTKVCCLMLSILPILLSLFFSHTHLSPPVSLLPICSILCFIYSQPHLTPQQASQRHLRQPRLYQQSL